MRMRFPRGGDRDEQHQARAVGAFAGRALEDLAALFRRTSRASENRRRRAADARASRCQLSMKACCICADGRAFDAIMRVAPEPRVRPLPLPVIGDAGAADETNAAVDDQQLAMGAEVHGEIEEPKDLQLDRRAGAATFIARVAGCRRSRARPAGSALSRRRARVRRAPPRTDPMISPSLQRKFSNVIVRCAERMPSSMAGKISSPFSQRGDLVALEQAAARAGCPSCGRNVSSPTVVIRRDAMANFLLRAGRNSARRRASRMPSRLR